MAPVKLEVNMDVFDTDLRAISDRICCQSADALWTIRSLLKTD